MNNNKQSSVCNEFVPYEEALELKELGFDEHHYILCVDTPDGREYTKVGRYPILYQQAFRWFDENTELMAFVVPSIKDGHFDWLIRIGWDEELECEEAYSSRLEAELECLKKLIEIVKEQNNE